MKRLLLIVIAALAISNMVNAQCASCTPVFQSCPPNGGLCNKMDTAYANHPYDKVINFFMPQYLSPSQLQGISCGGCSSVKLRHIRITGVSGMPGGLNNPYFSNGGTYNVEGGDSLGCARFCGTPLVPGVYPITVYLSADVTAIGTTIGNVDADNQPQAYKDTLYVLPDTVIGVTTFTYGNNGSSACNTLTIDLQALRTAPQPNLTRWFWDLGNGSSYEGKTPGQVTYNNTSVTKPDTFPVALTTVYYDYRIKSVCLHLTANWYPDVNEAGSALDPEPYIILSNGFQSNTCSNPAPSTANPCYNNINQVIQGGTQTVHMEVWDDDNCGLLPIFASADDHVDDYDMTMQLGTQALFPNLGNSSGTVIIDTVPGVVLHDTLWVIVNPTPALPVIVASADTFCSNDSTRLTIGGGYNGFNIEWYRDTVFLAGITDSAFYTTLAGNYWVRVTNQLTGCQNVSALKPVVAAEAAPSAVSVIYNGTREFVTPFPATGFAVEWYYNGNLVTGETGKFLPYLGDGTYLATVYNVAFPSCRSASEATAVVGTNIAEISDNSVFDVKVYPNPNGGRFTLAFGTESTNNITITITSTLGQTVYQRKLEAFTGAYKQELDLTEFAKGVYVVTVESATMRLNNKMVVQ